MGICYSTVKTEVEPDRAPLKADATRSRCIKTYSSCISYRPAGFRTVIPYRQNAARSPRKRNKHKKSGQEAKSALFCGPHARHATIALDRPLHLLPPIQPLIQIGQHPPQHRRPDHGYKGSRAVHGHGRNVPRRKRRRIHITRVDARRIADGIDRRQGGGALRWRSGDAVADPGQHDDVTGVKGPGHEHHGDVAGRSGSCGCCEDEYGNGDEEGEDNVQVALAGAIGVPCVEKASDDGKDVGRSRQEEGVDVVVAEGGDDGGEEVCDGARGDDAGEDDHEHPHFRVGEGEAEAMPRGLFV